MVTTDAEPAFSSEIEGRVVHFLTLDRPFGRIKNHEARS
jgi:hypothetical protein